MAITIAATIFVFSLIVFIHEFGHFITAKLTGMQVDEFAIGFGPKVYSCQHGETLYSLRAIPLGGFNRIAGMTDEEELNERSFLNKPILSRLLVIAAGGIMNFLLAILLLWGVTFVSGTMHVSTEPIIGTIVEQSPAERVKMQPGDKIVSIGGTPITQWNDISKAVAEHSKSVVTVTIDRGGALMNLDMIPRFDSQTGRATLGITPVVVSESHGFFESARMAITRTGQLCHLMLTGIYSMITGQTKADLAGPIGVAQLAGQVASAGFVNLLIFTAFISINLGVLNLLPIPMLDGGHIILLVLEGILGRRMPKKALQYIQATGIAILGAIFLFAMFQDISRF